MVFIVALVWKKLAASTSAIPDTSPGPLMAAPSALSVWGLMCVLGCYRICGSCRVGLAMFRGTISAGQSTSAVQVLMDHPTKGQ